jgi:aerobic-type carbon monoxide dehydrogenase small subunit (CoxS/CutS family)
MSACGGSETTKTVTAGGTTSTVTKTVTNASTVTQTITVTSPGGGTQTSDLTTVKMTVNGREYELFTKPHWPLRDVLRKQLGITSLKDMCTGYGACGSCCLLMGGRPVLSCLTLAIECEGAEIITCEGIADASDPLIEAYSRNACMQCGFCTPGFVVTAKALLNHNPNPTTDEINEALSGNLCRCDTYPAHVAAIHEVAGQ